MRHDILPAKAAEPYDQSASTVAKPLRSPFSTILHASRKRDGTD